jgi:A/G-specific adenine glycosylase
MGEAGLLDSDRLVRVRKQIIKWFNENGREFSWRTTQNPYHILVAEMLLRRTTASAVARVYDDFLIRFNTPQKLKRARLSTVKRMISTLGLQSIRAKHLRETASILVKDYNGQVPKDAAALSSLPGVGRYVAAAVSNFAFGTPEPMVDGNVLHLMNRVFALGFESPMDEMVWDFMTRFGGKTQDSRLYWGIIDLVALVCLRRNPRCQTCPLLQNCSHFVANPK